MSVFQKSCRFAGACLKEGDWRGARFWTEDAKYRAQLHGIRGLEEECDAFLSVIQTVVRNVATFYGMTVEEFEQLA
jgi:hypothetical protein